MKTFSLSFITLVFVFALAARILRERRRRRPFIHSIPLQRTAEDEYEKGGSPFSGISLDPLLNILFPFFQAFSCMN